MIAAGVVAVAAWLLATVHEPVVWRRSAGGDPSYLEWARQDVKYIITDRERDEYLALTTEVARNRFVEQFWMRRDPTPNTPRNEFKEAHYRRMAAANALFTESYVRVVNGWRTDRGRVYVVYGPPDRRSFGQQRDGIAIEEWLYRRIPGIGENVRITFLDCGGGRYRVLTDHTDAGEPMWMPGFTFTSREPGPEVRVLVPPDRELEISIPIPATPGEYRISGTWVEARGSSGSFGGPLRVCYSVAETDCVRGSRYVERWSVDPGISPGDWVLNLSLYSANGISKAYTVRFRVEMDSL
jgi:GWxTD domain-containing protein